MRQLYNLAPSIVLVLVVVLVLVLGSAGCGGGGEIPANTGRATFTVIWPAPGRLIPTASNSIRVEIKQGSTVFTSKILARPAGGGSASAVFNALPLGTLTAVATAFPQADGTGTAQAKASVPLTIVAGQNTNFSVTMATTIDHLEISPAHPTVVVNLTVQLIATAKNAAGDVVLTAPSKLVWSSNSGSATVANGTVTGKSAGSATITVTDQESGKSASVTVLVTNPGPSPVAWWRAENDALDSAGTANGTAVGNVTYAAGVSGQAFQFDGVGGGVNVPDVPQLALTGSFTIEAQIKVLSLASQVQGGGLILFRGDDRGGFDPFLLSVNYDGNIDFRITDASGTEENVYAPIAVGRFVHVIASLDASNGTMLISLDGAVVAQTTTTVRPFKDLDPTLSPGIGIGNVQAQPNPNYNFPFHGLIDELKVYNVVVGP